MVNRPFSIGGPLVLALLLQFHVMKASVVDSLLLMEIVLLISMRCCHVTSSRSSKSIEAQNHDSADLGRMSRIMPLGSFVQYLFMTFCNL